MGGDLRGAGRLAVDAVAGLAGLVARLPGTRPSPSGRTRGITAFIYATARGALYLVWGTVDTALSLLGRFSPHGAPGPVMRRCWQH
jgi:hypothetical protein